MHTNSVTLATALIRRLMTIRREAAMLTTDPQLKTLLTRAVIRIASRAGLSADDLAALDAEEPGGRPLLH
jgi:hypothetical protein